MFQAKRTVCMEALEREDWFNRENEEDLFAYGLKKKG